MGAGPRGGGTETGPASLPDPTPRPGRGHLPGETASTTNRAGSGPRVIVATCSRRGSIENQRRRQGEKILIAWANRRESRPSMRRRGTIREIQSLDQSRSKPRPQQLRMGSDSGYADIAVKIFANCNLLRALRGVPDPARRGGAGGLERDFAALERASQGSRGAPGVGTHPLRRIGVDNTHRRGP